MYERGVVLILLEYNNSMKTLIIDLFLKEQKKLYLIAYAITKDPYLADDVMQETFIKISEKYLQLKDASHIMTWTTRILINECKDQFRRNKHVHLDIDEITETLFVEFNDEDIKFFDMIKGLNPDERQIISLKYFEKLKIDEIAIILKMPASTVKTRLYRTLDKLKKDWSD